VGAAAARVDAVVLHLVLVPAVADAEHEAPTGDAVERRNLLGIRDRIVLRRQRDAGSEQDALRQRRGGRERDDRVGAPVVLLGQLRLAGRRRRAPARRDVRVLGDVQGVEAAGLGLARQLRHVHGEIGGVNRDAELHRGSPSEAAQSTGDVP
jgi:hypothetical protein